MILLASIWELTHWLDIACRTIIASLPGMDNFHFQSTGSIAGHTNERSVRRRLPLIARMMNFDMAMRMCFITAGLATIVFSFLERSRLEAQMGPSPLLGALFALLQLILGTAVPLVYMIFPPDVPEREDLMEVDEHGQRRPKAEAMRVAGTENEWKGTAFEAAFILLCALW